MTHSANAVQTACGHWRRRSHSVDFAALEEELQGERQMELRLLRLDALVLAKRPNRKKTVKVFWVTVPPRDLQPWGTQSVFVELVTGGAVKSLRSASQRRALSPERR